MPQLTHQRKREKMIKLKKGDEVFLSQIGNNGFFYPTDKTETLMEDVDADTPAWLGGGADMQPALIPMRSIRVLDMTERKIPVWISKRRKV